MDHPRTADEIFADYQQRFKGILRALTEGQLSLPPQSTYPGAQRTLHLPFPVVSRSLVHHL